MPITRFEDIEAWQEARNLTRIVYEITHTDRFRRDFGLTDQIRRASVSIMANIAEGFDAGSDTEFIRFLGYALRSATEVQSHLYVALDQTYIAPDEFQHLTQQTIVVKNLISGFIRYLKRTKRTH